MSHGRVILPFFLFGGLLGTPAFAQPNASVRVLDYFWANSSQEDLPNAINAVRRAQNQQLVRDELRKLFSQQWIAGSGTPGPTLQQFDALAQLCGALGPSNTLLVDLLTGPSAPRAWRRADFREYIRAALPFQAGSRATVERLVERIPSDPQEVVSRFVFLTDVLPAESARQIREQYVGRISTATPAQMTAYHKALLALPPGFTQFRPSEESANIRKVLGDHLYTLSPATWSQAGEALPGLVGAASVPATGFFEKAADHFRRQPGDRDPAAIVLAMLSDLISDPGTAFRILDPAHDAGWFAWLHTAPVLLKLHSRRELLEASYSMLKSFASSDFGTMFPGAVMYYYGKEGYEDRVFADLVRPQANGPYARAVLQLGLETTPGRTLRSQHREILARDILGGGRDPLSPSWSGATPPARLDYAIRVYSHLLDLSPAPGRLSLSGHLTSPLLDEIVSGFLDLFRRTPSPTDRILRLMELLASHLEDCRRAGGDTSSAAPLLRLEREISDDVTQAIAAIANAAGEAQLQAVDQFVERLSMAMRIRILVARALGRPPTWLSTARETLRQRVFGIVDPASNRTVYWSGDLTRWRAGILERIDGPLRNLLKETGAGDEGQLWFTDVYVPLARVHGFLRVMRERSPAAYPILDWVRSDPQRKAARLRQLFQTLQTDRWVDADAVVTDLAREHWETVHPGSSVWTVPPDVFFAGYWGVNANLLIYRQLLGVPPQGVNWQTPLIAAKAVEELETNRLAIGPVFPSSPSVADQHESVWTYAAWVENLVTAAEWQQSPFRGRTGVLPWQERLQASGKSELPFRFVLKGEELSRRVDGQLRLRLARLLLAHADDQNGTTRINQLDRLASIAVLLPNHPDNAGQASVEPARALRLEVYRMLSTGFSAAAAGSPDREMFARHMMRLDVAARTGAKQEPAFDSILQALSRGGEAEAAADIQAERLALLAIIDGTAEDNISLARTYIDGQLVALLPVGWNEANANIIAQQFSEILSRLSEPRVRAFLQLRRRMQTLADALAGESNRPADFIADLERLERSLELVNSHVWFTRRTLNPSLYFRPDDKTGTWWPALVVLAWPDYSLQSRTMDALAKYHGPQGERLKRVQDALFHQLVQLNEAVYATVKQLAARNDAIQILKSHHAIPWRMLNLRLLAEAEGTVDASPEALASDCFSGLLINYKIASLRTEPSDDAVWQRLFESFDYLLPAEQRRSKSLMVNLDDAVKLADDWAHSEKLPALLRDAASAFASTSREQAKDLLAGAGTPAGVMRAFHEILARIDKARERTGYVSFYTNAFTVSGPALSTNLTNALAGPYFREGLSEQMGSIESLLAGWRQYTRSGSVSSTADAAYRRTFDSVLAQLVRGDGRPPEAAYIWQPVDKLRSEEGLKPDKPTEFLSVAKWLFDLEKRYADPNLGALFRRGGSK